MTRLFIDGTEVTLMSDFECDFFTRNPFFTRDGDFTYDISIDLRAGTNRLIYSFINRPDVGRKPTNRTAVITSDNHTIVTGREIILSVDDNIAKIQIVSDNSELNYIYTGDKTIRQLDLGTIQLLPNEASNLNLFYPRVDHVCCPVLMNRGIFDVSDFAKKNDVVYNEIEWDVRNGIKYKADADMVIQPFLMTCIERVVEALGYTISYNVLDNDELAKRAIVVNGVHTNEVNRMLPNWKVQDFISEVEKLFNVIFLVSSRHKTISIFNVVDFYNDRPLTEIPTEDVLDEYKVVYDQKESLYLTYENVSYELGSSTWYKYQSLNDELREKCTYVNDTFEGIKKKYLKDNPYTIFREVSTSANIVFNNIRGTEQSYSGMEIVDELRPIVDEKSNSKCDLKIIPAEIYGNHEWITGFKGGGSKNYDGWITSAIPVIANVKVGDEQKYAYEAIENGIILKEDTADSNIFISVYLGCIPYMYSPLQWQGVDDKQPTIESMRVPMAIAHPYHICYNRAGSNRSLYKLADNQLSLSLQRNMKTRYYSGSVDVDTRTEKTFLFVADRIFDPKNIFLIRNKKYFCKQIKYVINPTGLNRLAEGIFYQM